MSDDFVQELKKKYVEQVSSTISIHRLAAVVVSVLLLHYFRKPPGTATFGKLFELSLFEVFGSSNSLLLKATIGDVLLAVLFVTCTHWVYRWLRPTLLREFRKRADFEKYALDLLRTSLPATSGIVAVDYALARDLEPTLEQSKQRMGFLSASAEAVLTLAITLAICGLWLDVTAFLAGGIALAIYLGFEVAGYMIFLSEYVPAEIQRRALLHKRADVDPPQLK